MHSTSEKLSLVLFRVSSAFLIFSVGYIFHDAKIFPYQLYSQAKEGLTKVQTSLLGSAELPWFYTRLEEPLPAFINNTEQPTENLTLLTKIAADKNIAAEVINLEGEAVHTWNIDWFELWPDAKHLPVNSLPKEKPGTHIHGAVLMENGDLIFNFEHKGLMRIDPDGEVVWRLPYATHHSIERDGDGNLWVCGSIRNKERISRLPHIEPSFYEDTILKVTPAGEILEEWHVADILRENGYAGLLYLGTLENDDTQLNGGEDITDILHLNDVEPFPSEMEEGLFTQGDVMISLRNINTVFVFNTESNKIKFITTGELIRQHDPDFIDGNTFSVFDNNNNSDFNTALQQSRIVIFSARENTRKVFFEGTPEQPFFSSIMGNHQWLSNGNLLITESMSGRGFEIDKNGEIVWQYINYVDDGVVGIVEQMQRLPAADNQLFTDKK